MTRSFLFRSIILPILVSALASSLAAADQIGAPFETAPEDLLAIAAEHPGDEDLLILLQESVVTLDEEGRSTLRHRLIYQARTQSGAEVWDSVSAHWAPWYQEKPVIEARVIESNGKVHELDPSTISESPARESFSKIYSDARLFRAPLPAISAGSVVEEVTTVRDIKPFFEAGVVTSQVMAHYFPVLTSRLVVDAPESAVPHWKTRLIDIEPSIESNDGRVRLTFENRDTEPIEDTEGSLPFDQTGLPLVAIATGESWQSVARAYHEIVESSLDDSELLIPAPSGSKDPLETLRAAVSSLHENIRYTGLEFGENSIIPRDLGEIQAKKYGDCKDKAVLLVRMLSEAGIDASVALLRTGQGMDVFDELPGFGMFDHAIVYIPSLDLFVDATAESTRVGNLPSAVQGRKALVADPSTTSLVTIPFHEATDNRQVETRIVSIPPYGRGRVIEEVRGTGELEESLRYIVKDVPQDDLIEMFSEYAESAYLDEELDSVDVKGVSDVNSEFVLALEMKEAGRAVADLQESVVAIVLNGLFDRLPYDFFDTEAEEERKNDFVFYTPHQIEWRYEIETAPGFAVIDLPEATTLSLGKATYHHEFEERDGKVFGKVTFDSGPRRISSTTFEEMKTALGKRLEEPVLLLRWEHTAQGHLVRGEIREAIEELERLEQTLPNDALNHTRLALAYLQAGLGQDARDEIDRAIALDPTQAIIHSQKAYILQHDLFGRHLAPGWDREGTIEALKRARELDPDDTDVAFNLAVLYEYDDRGVRYGKGADLDAAIQAYREVEDELFETQGFDLNLPLALLYAGRYDEFEALIEARPSFNARDTYRAVSMLVRKGASAARDAAVLIKDRQKRAEAMVTAGQILIRLRRYDEAAAAYREAATLSTNAGQLTQLADTLGRIGEEEGSDERDPNDPVHPVRSMMTMMFDLDHSPSDLAPFFSRAIGSKMAAEDYEELDRVLDILRRQVNEETLPLQFVADVTKSMLRYSSEGDDELGYRVYVQGLDGVSGSGEEMFYVVRDGDRYAVIGTPSERSSIAWEMLARVDAGQTESAAAILDLVREDAVEASRRDPLETSIFAKLWQLGLEPDENRVRLAAAALLMEGDEDSARAGLELIDSLPEEVVEEQFPWSGLARIQGLLSTRDFESMNGLAARLRESHPDSEIASELYAASLIGMNAWEPLREWARAALDEDPSDRTALRALARAEVEMGEGDEAMRLFDQLLTTGRPGPGDFNDAAWYALLAESDMEVAVQRAQSAVKMMGEVPGAGGILNTLAAVYAEAGRPVEAKMTVWKAMELDQYDEPRHYDWYVLGRIAEYYGLEDAATRSYHQVLETAEVEDASRGSVTTMARERLKGLQ